MRFCEDLAEKRQIWRIQTTAATIFCDCWAAPQSLAAQTIIVAFIRIKAASSIRATSGTRNDKVYFDIQIYHVHPLRQKKNKAKLQILFCKARGDKWYYP